MLNMNKKRRRKIRMTAITLLLIIPIVATTLVKTAVAWTSDTQLTGLTGEPEAWDQKPSVTQTRDGKLWVFWSSDMLEGQYEIYYKTSPDKGDTWSNATRFTWSDAADDTPSIMQSRNGTLWVFWASSRTGNYEIFYRPSIDVELEWWSWDCYQFTNNSCGDSYPSITQNVDGTIFVVWQREVAVGEYRLFCRISLDEGMTWSDETPLTENSWNISPSVTWTYNGTLWVVWSYYNMTEYHYDLVYKTTSDNGLSWSDTRRLTTDPGWDQSPSVLQAPDGKMWVFWCTDRGAKYAIFYKTYNMSTMTWSLDTLLTSSSGDEIDPKATITQDRKIWVVWSSTRSDFDVYYKISDEITPVHDISINNIKYGLRWVPRGIPLDIDVIVENQGTSAENFDVTVYADQNVGDLHIYIGTQSVSLASDATTTLTFTWDTQNTPYGSYYISANATIVSGEYDILDNYFCARASMIGGICVPWQPQSSVSAMLGHAISTILIIVVLGIVVLVFFKTLMSVRPHLPWRLFQTSHKT